MKYLIWVLMICPAAYAAPCPTEQPKAGSALVQIEQTWAHSLEQRDPATLACILADEFEDVGADGRLTDRAATLAKAAEPRAVHDQLSDLQAHVQGDLGYIRGLATATDAQGKVMGRVRFTDVYVYRDQRWQCVAGQETLLAATDIGH
jgi:ketosteroid isomerase-like protein